MLNERTRVPKFYIIMNFKTEKSTTVIDISDNLLKVLAVSNGKKGKAPCVLDCVKLQSEEEKAIAKEARALLSKHKILNSHFMINFPRHLVTVKNVRLPATNDFEIKNMAELQAIKYLPYSREEIVVSHKVLNITPDGYSDVMLVLAQKKSVDRYINIFKLAGVNIEKIGLSSEGILNWYIELAKSYNGSVAIIDVDMYHTHIQIIRDGALFFSRSVPFDVCSAESNKNSLLREIKLSFGTYLKERNEGVSAMLVSGGEAYAKGIGDFLAANITIPCEIIPQADSLKVDTAGEQILDKIRDYSYAALFGLASSPASLAINLIPQDILTRKSEEITKKELIKSAILLLCIGAVIFAVLEKKMLEKDAYLQKLEAKLKTIEPEITRLSKLKESNEIISNQLIFQGSAIDIIKEIYRILPKDVSLTLMEFDDKDKILLRGAARELSSVFSFLPVLEKSMYFENAKMGYAAKRTFRQIEFADFEIVCRMSKI